MSSQGAISIEFAGVSYQVDGSRELISDLNLRIPAGEVFMLLGRSGSGRQPLSS
jgi:ABC-type bacteriocin/lantibiotic exporter with double-glycine peptidase domain